MLEQWMKIAFKNGHGAVCTPRRICLFCVFLPSKGQVTRSVVVILKRIICSAKLCIQNVKNLHSKYEKIHSKYVKLQHAML